MEEKKLALHEEFKEKYLECDEREYLESLAHLYKDTDTTIDEIASILSGGGLHGKLVEYFLELEHQSLVSNGQWDRPKVIDETERGWKYEDGLWYEKDVYQSGICPLCGNNGSSIRWINGKGCIACFDCKLVWDFKGPSPSTWPDSGGPTEEEIKRYIEEEDKILSFKSPTEIYAKSEISDKIMMDVGIRTLREDVERKRFSKNLELEELKADPFVSW